MQTFEEDHFNLDFLVDCNKGGENFHLLIMYIRDRYKNEYSWVQTIKELNKMSKFPIRLVWGDSDAVSNIIIP